VIGPMPDASRHRAFDAASVIACQRLVEPPGFRLRLFVQMIATNVCSGACRVGGGSHVQQPSQAHNQLHAPPRIPLASTWNQAVGVVTHRREDVLTCKPRIRVDEVGLGCTSAQLSKDKLDRDSCPAEAADRHRYGRLRGVAVSRWTVPRN
jgi:hypothetical protein